MRKKPASSARGPAQDPIVAGTAVVRWFNLVRGYGFGKMVGGPHDGQEVLLHHSNIRSEGFRRLEEGQTVKVEVQMTDMGLKAFSITPLKPDTCAERSSLPNPG